MKKDLERLQTQTRDLICLAKQLNEFLNVLATQSCPTLGGLHVLYPTRLLCPWNLPGMNAGVGSSSLLHRIFLMRDRTRVFE